MTDPRTPVFEAVRAITPPGVFNDAGNIHALHNLLDALGAPREKATARTVSQAAIDLIKHFEGLKLAAYRDTGGVPTIGVGHTRGVKMGDVITEAQADAFLREDLEEAMADVRRLFPETTQGQFDALTSFTFNLGAEQVGGSTLRRKHNAGDWLGAKAEFGRWVYDDGVKLNGLIRRRAAEAEVYAS